jgi:hypothetical protein
MHDTVLLAVEVTAGHPPTTVLRYVCRAYPEHHMRPMARSTAAAHLNHYHGYTWINARIAVEQAESEYHDRVAEGARSKRLLDVLEIYS